MTVSAPGVPLRTRRLVLRRFRAADAPALAAYRSDPAVARYQGWTAPVPPDDVAELVREFAALDPAGPGWFQYAVQLGPGGPLIGDVGVNLHENGMQAEIGYTFAAAHQGRGYATEAVARVLEYLFTDRGLRRVSAECDARNVASARLLRRLGFTQEGCRRDHTWIHEEWTDDLLFGLLAEDRRVEGPR
jgi:Acetyltransferases, including N-acetylases of ribosomal proteins